ncbi:unnamed protein product [Camellia sinensis]
MYAFYAKYAKHLGFAIAYGTQNYGNDGKLKYFGIECNRARTLEPSLSSKNDCKAKVSGSLQKDGTFKLVTVALEHTHDLRRLETNDEAGIGVAKNFHSIVVEARGYEALTFDEQDARNHIENARRLRLGVGDAESVALYFHMIQQQNSNFYSAMDFDGEGRLRNLFWTDARSGAGAREIHTSFGATGQRVKNGPTHSSHSRQTSFEKFLLVRLLQNRKPFFPERNSSLQSFHMDPEAAWTAQESLDLVFHMSNILDAGLDRHTLSILIALCYLGQNPKAMGAVVKELRREPSSSSPMPTSSSSVIADQEKHGFMSLKLVNANMDDEKRRLTFRALNRMGAKSRRITSPSSLLYTVFLLFNGDTNLFANLKGENDLCRIAAVDDEGFKALFLLKLVWWGKEKGKAAVETEVSFGNRLI